MSKQQILVGAVMALGLASSGAVRAQTSPSLHIMYGWGAENVSFRVEGEYFDVLFRRDSVIPHTGEFAMVGPAVNWACTGEVCAPTGPMTASLVFTVDSARQAPQDSWMTRWNIHADMKAAIPLIDPFGKTWGVAAADPGQWEFKALVGPVVGPVATPENPPLFMTAFGQSTLDIQTNARALLPWYDDLYWGGMRPSGDIISVERVIFDENSSASVAIGPGIGGMAGIGGEYPDAAGFPFGVDVTHTLATPYHAFPSITDPRCRDLSCLDYKGGMATMQSYALTFEVIATPSAVPEAQSLWMLLGGLGVLAGLAKRRSQS